MEATNFQVKWESTCFICKKPVDVRLVMSYDTMLNSLHDMVVFSHHHPVDMVQNEMLWKVRSGKAYKCCRWCFERPWPTPNLRQREVRGRMVLPPRSEALTSTDIYFWFKSLYHYITMDPDGKYKAPRSEDMQTWKTGIILSISAHS